MCDRPKTRCLPRCSGCSEVGHTKSSLVCPLRIAKTEQENQQIRAYALAATNIPIQWPVGDHTLCAQRYHQITTSMERTAHNTAILRLDPVRILNAIHQELSVNCGACGRVCLKPLTEWREVGLCDSCYLGHRAERDLLWSNAREVMGPLQCKFCAQECPLGGTHLDHINMFEKSDSVCNLIARGAPFTLIVAEIARCQLLCRSCHAFVTHCENLLGFTSCKKELTKLALTTPEAACLRRAELFVLYQSTMCEYVYTSLQTP